MTEADTTQEAPSRIPGWLPLGLASFGVLGVLRWLSLLAIDSHSVGGGDGASDWNVANGLPEQLLHVAVLALAGSALVAKSEGKRLSLALLGAVAFALAATGWLLAPLAFQPSLSLGMGLESAAPLVLASLVWSLLLFGVVRVTGNSTPARIVGALLGAGLALLPFWFGLWSVETPVILVRNSVRQLIDDANFDKLTYTSWSPAFEDEIVRMRPPEKANDPLPLQTAEEFREHAKRHLRQMVTPAVYKEYDVGDKYTLVSPPGTTIEFDVNQEDGPVWLRTSAGADVKSFDVHCPPDVKYDVRFEILVGDSVRWDETVRIERGLPAGERNWKHAGDKSGIALVPGDHVTLRTSFSSGRAPGDVPSYRAVMAGWSDLRLESETPTPRLHSTPEQPNIVLIVMDTLRADRLSNYGFDRNTSPNLTRLADRGVQYDRAYSTASWTWPSTASMLTGLYPAQHGVVSNEACTLAYECESVAEVLQRRGFTTGGFSCNPLIHEDRYYDQGFEHFDAAKQFRKGDEILPNVNSWLDANYGSRFFLYLHMADPHTPHRPHPDDLQRFAGTPPDNPPTLRVDQPGQKQHTEWDWFDHYGGKIDMAAKEYFAYQQREAEWQRRNAGKKLEDREKPEKPVAEPVLNELVPPPHQRWVADVYAASVASCDRYVGDLLDKLDALGLEDRTLVIFTSDHGEELLEHGRYGHGQSLFEEVVHVPLIVAGPGVPSGRRTSEPVSNRHVAPTIAWVGGGDLPAVPVPQDLTSPENLHDEDIQIQTVKGLVDGRKIFVLEGIVQGDLVWHYARRCTPWSWEVIYPRNDKTQRPVEEHLRRFDLGLDPKQLHPTTENAADSEVVAYLLKLLDAQGKARKGDTRGVGGAMEAILNVMATGYAGEDEDDADQPKLPE